MKPKQNTKKPLAALCAAATILSLGSLRADHHEKGHHDHGDHKHEKAEKKGHDHDDLVGPNEGRILHEVSPHAELFVTKDRKIKITFIDNHGKVIPATDQIISVICGKRTNPTRLSFAKDGDSLLSEKPLPEGKNIPTVLQIKTAPDAKPAIIRINLDLSDCPNCKHLEYACTCDHHGDHGDHKGHKGHDHGDHDHHDHGKK